MATTIFSLLAKTRAAADQRRAEAGKRFRSLVVDAAKGKELDPDKVVEFLDANGYSVEEFQAAVELQAKRLDWKAKADEREKRATHKANIQAKIASVEAACTAAIEKARAEAREALLTLNADLAEATRLVQEADNAHWKLQETATAENREKLHDLDKRISELRTATRQYTDAIHRGNQDVLKHENEIVAGGGHHRDPRFDTDICTRATAALANVKRSIARDQATLDDMHEQIRKLEAEREAATKLLLAP